MKFELGQVVITRNCLNWFTDNNLDALPFLRRHASGDWGDLTLSDKRANDQALIDGGRLLSAYTAIGQKMYILSEADRSLTTMMLAEDY